jgi:hypothetical protein
MKRTVVELDEDILAEATETLKAVRWSVAGCRRMFFFWMHTG